MTNNTEVTEEMLLHWVGSDNTVGELVELILPFINGSNEWSLQEFKEELINYWRNVASN